MKKILIQIVTIGTLFLSCTTDDAIMDSSSKELESYVNQAFAKSGSSINNTITKNGKVYYSGFGYDPNSKTCYDLPFGDIDAMQPTTYISEPLVKTIEIIKTYKQLESYVSSGSRSEAYEYAIRNGGIVDEIANKIRFSETTMTVAARVSIKRYKYLASGFPFLTSDAYALLDQGRIEEFVNKYGSMYVDSQTLGGDVYYLYTFSDSSFNSSTISEFESQIKSSIENLFKEGNGTYISPSDRIRISNALRSTGSYSSVPGFVPANEVKTVSEFEAESSRFMDFLSQHPEQAKTVDMNLKRYYSLSGRNGVQEALDTAFFNRTQCFINGVQWALVRGDLKFIAENTMDNTLKIEANTAIAEVETLMQNAINCSNSNPPQGGEYRNIKDRYNIEKGLY